MKDNVLNTLMTLRRVLREIDWDSNEPGLPARYQIDFGPPKAPVSEVVVRIDADTESFVFLANFFPSAVNSNRDAVVRHLTRINWNLPIGNFEMNCDDGAVRYRLGLDFSGSDLSASTLRHVMLTAMKIIEENAPGLSGAMAGR